MQVTDAPVSRRAGNTEGDLAGSSVGLNVPPGRTPTLMIGPIAGLKLALRHGMGEEAKVDGRLNDLLD